MSYHTLKPSVGNSTIGYADKLNMSTLPLAARIIARSGLSVAVVAASFLGTSVLIIHKAIPIPAFAFVLTVAFLSYAVDRLVDALVLRRWVNSPDLTHLKLSVALSVIVALFSEPFGNTTFSVLATIFPLAVAPYRFVKRIKYAKAFYAAFFWAMLVLFVSSSGGDMPWKLTLATFVFVFGKALLGLITCDIKDAESDRREGIVTFPSEKGVKATLLVLHSMNIGLALLTFTLVFSGIFPRFMLIAEFHAVAVAIILVIMRSARGARVFYTSEFGMDGAYALLFAFALIGSRVL